MFWCLCTERKNGWGRYFPVARDSHGYRGMWSSVYSYYQSAGCYRRWHRNGIPCQRSCQGYGVYPVPSYCLVSSGRSPQLLDYWSDERIWSCPEEPGRRRIHAEIRSSSFIGSARHCCACHRQRNETARRWSCLSGCDTQRSGRDQKAFPQYIQEVSQPGNRYYKRLYTGSSGCSLFVWRY